MVMLNQLKSGSIARIVKFENEPYLKEKLNSKGIIEGSFLKIISCFGLIVIKIDKRMFIIDKRIAKDIRVIELFQTPIKI